MEERSWGKKKEKDKKRREIENKGGKKGKREDIGKEEKVVGQTKASKVGDKERNYKRYTWGKKRKKWQERKLNTRRKLEERKEGNRSIRKEGGYKEVKNNRNKVMRDEREEGQMLGNEWKGEEDTGKVRKKGKQGPNEGKRRSRWWGRRKRKTDNRMDEYKDISGTGRQERSKDEAIIQKKKKDREKGIKKEEMKAKRETKIQGRKDRTKVRFRQQDRE